MRTEITCSLDDDIECYDLQADRPEDVSLVIRTLQWNGGIGLTFRAKHVEQLVLALSAKRMIDRYLPKLAWTPKVGDLVVITKAWKDDLQHYVGRVGYIYSTPDEERSHYYSVRIDQGFISCLADEIESCEPDPE